MAVAATLAVAPRPARADTIAIVGATVYTRPDRKLDDATVVIVDGKITAVGAGVAVPAGATRIDGTGKIVTAGLIEADSSLGLVTVDAEPSANDGAPALDADKVHAAFRVVDAYDADALTIPVARAGGVTSAVAVPRGALVAGQSAWFTLADGVTADDAVAAPAAMHASLGNAASDASGGSRGRAIEMLRALLDDAATYARTRSAYDRNQSRELAADRLDLEALQPVLRGRLPLVVAAESEGDIRAALRLAKQRKLRLAISGGTEAWKVADELARAGVAVILDPTDNLPRRLEAPDVRDDNAAVLAAAGVPVAIATMGDPDAARTIRQLAGNAVADGMPWAQALAALTTVPAALYGVKDRGTVEKGQVADVVVWSGDPLELSSRAEVVIIGGVVQSLVTHQTELFDRYR
ncbi:MAG: amidohydrolase family protein [Kofleriaceae bacterium]|nr:amidohydrolase family protein [Kofleriaceae bacterium]